MDINKLVEVLRATLDPIQREEAEQQLKIMRNIVGFTPVLLQVITEESVDMPVRRAGAIHLKNLCNQFCYKTEDEKPTDPVLINTYEQDRFAIRSSIIEVVIHAPDPIRVQLCVCIRTIIKDDYPYRWPNFTEKVAMYIQSDNHTTLMGALLCLYQMVKICRYKHNEERKILDNAMAHILPLCYQRYIQLMQDHSEASNLVQKQILKIYYAFIENSLPLETVTKEIFTQWMELINQTLDRPVPEQNHIKDEDRAELVWWKVKKWAVHLLSRTFERYGCPGDVIEEHNQFAEWYLKAFSGEVIQVLLKILEQYKQKIYVAPRVLQQALNFLIHGINHAFAWKFIEPHICLIIQEVIFPLLCQSDSDEELWQSDPQEYIRLKYDVGKNSLSLMTTAQELLYFGALKRKVVLQKSMDFCMQILTQETSIPRQKDGAFHMIGSLSKVLLMRKIYKNQVEGILITHVYPEFTSPHGYLRSRACWVIRVFSDMKYKVKANVYRAWELTKNCLCYDKELPVKVEAAIGLQMLIREQGTIVGYVQPTVEPVILELLNVLRETVNEYLTNAMEEFLCTFVCEVTVLGVKMMSHLAITFSQILEMSSNDSKEKAGMALGILNTMESIIDNMEERKKIVPQCEWEGIVLGVVGLVLQKQSLIADIYRKMLSLLYSLTCPYITLHMWQVFDMLYEMFKRGGIDYFTDMMPALHNYITVDTSAFLSNPNRLKAIYNMCKQVLAADIRENIQCQAAKLLEVILLQCPGQVDSIVRPSVELVLERLTRKVIAFELKTMCLQVMIAALCYNTPLLIETLNSMDVANVQGSVMQQFLMQWICDVDTFLDLHDRKIHILGMCKLLNLVDGARPAEVTGVGSQIIPSALILFEGLGRAYEIRAKKENLDSDVSPDDQAMNDNSDSDDSSDDQAMNDNSDSDDSSDDSDDCEPDALAIDQDKVNEDGHQYIEKLEISVSASCEDGQQYVEKLEISANHENVSNDDDDFDGWLESYQTWLDKDCDVDEYVIFKEIITNLHSMDPAWYGIVTSQLTPEQTEAMEDVFKLADQRKRTAEFRKSRAAVTVS